MEIKTKSKKFCYFLDETLSIFDSSYTLSNAADNESSVSLATTTEAPKYVLETCKTTKNKTEKDLQNEEDFVLQNMSNKQHEKFNRPCANGFCYCFTSDSDEIKPKLKTSKIRDLKTNKSTEVIANITVPISNKKMPSYKHVCQFCGKKVQVIPKKCIKHVEHSSADSSNRSQIQNQQKIENIISKQKVPLIRIVQEIHKNVIISEIQIKKRRIKKKKLQHNPSIDKNIINAGIVKESTESHVYPHSQSSNSDMKRKGGKLLLKRIGSSKSSGTEQNTPPKKPPRSFSSSTDTDCIPKLNSKDITIEQNKAVHFENHKNEHINNNEVDRNIVLPSCPNFSQITLNATNLHDPNFSNINNANLQTIEENKSKVGWVSPEVVQMLQYDQKNVQEIKNYNSGGAQPQQQMGWVTSSPKLSIDTVDNSETINNVSFLNYATNMEFKSTPIKNEIFKENQNTEIPSKFIDIPEISKKDNKNGNDLKNNKNQINKLNFHKIAITNTKNFIKNSKQKILNITKSKNVQKTNENINTLPIVTLDRYLHPKKLEFEGIYSNTSKPEFSQSLQENPYGANFNFNRIVNSPLSTKKFSFIPRKALKNIYPTPSTEIVQSYKSYAQDFHEDCTITINDVLNDIRAKLEDHNTQIKNQGRNLYPINDLLVNGNTEYYPKQATIVDVHEEPIYSEIKENVVQIGQQISNSLERVCIAVNNDPRAIYTKIIKTQTHTPILQRSISCVPDSKRILTITNKNRSILSLDSDTFIENLFNSADKHSSVEQIYQGDNLSKTPPDITDGHEIQPIQDFTLPKEDQKTRNTKLLEKRSYSCPQSNTEDSSSNSNELQKKYTNDSYISITRSLSTCSQKSKNFGQKLRCSIRRGHSFFKIEKDKISKVFNGNKFGGSNHINMRLSKDELDNIKKTQIAKVLSCDSLKKKLEQTVEICRVLPELNCSNELVEAERLLLYSTIKDRWNPKHDDSENIPGALGFLEINSFQIPTNSKLSNDTYFNYFYICVFANGKEIKSTQSAEKHNNLVFFENCNIKFCDLAPDFKIDAYLYVLRLRKFSTDVNISSKRIINRLSSQSSLDSTDEIVSRFKLYTSFTIRGHNLIPFYLVNHENCNYKQDWIILQTQNSFTISTNNDLRYSKVYQDIKLDIYAKVYLENVKLNSFVNIADTKNLSDWKNYYCQLLFFSIFFWDSPSDCNTKDPVFIIDLNSCSDIQIAPTENIVSTKSYTLILTSFFYQQEEQLSKIYLISLETDEELNYWMECLNKQIQLIKDWHIIKK